MQNQNGKFYIVATPIGNLGDITLRAIDILKQVDLVLCEDTRVTAKLLQHLAIKKTLLVYNDHSDENIRYKISERLKNGENIALVSDAGTPLISDPGYKLVRKLQDENFEVDFLPGACSPIAALCLSGIPSNRFMFIGFLPNKLSAKQEIFMELKTYKTSIVFFEAASRLIETLEILEKISPLAQVAVVKEITKLHQQVIRNNPFEVKSYFLKNEDRLRGEIIVVLEMYEEENSSSNLEEILNKLLKDMSVKDAVEIAASQFSLPKKQIYKIALGLKS